MEGVENRDITTGQVKPGQCADFLQGAQDCNWVTSPWKTKKKMDCSALAIPD